MTITKPRSCDFCHPDTLADWVYPARSFTAAMVDERTGQLARDRDGKLMPMHQMNGSWLACSPCARLIEADDFDGLLERHIAVAKADDRMARRLLPALWDGFRQQRYGERIPYAKLADCPHAMTEIVKNPANPDVQPGRTCMVCGVVVEPIP